MADVTTGFTADSLASMIAGAGFYTKGGTLTGSTVTGVTPLGVTDGGSRFNEGRSVRTVTADGIPAGVRGLEIVESYDPTLTTNVKELSDALLATIYGSAWGTIGTVTGSQGMLMPDIGTFLGGGAYIDDLRLWTKRGDGKYFALYLESARPEPGELATQAVEFALPVTFRARKKPNGDYSNLNVPPFRFEIHDAPPTKA